MLKEKAFTLVELIVVITILSILGTIGFISLQGYSKSARESTRISDLNNISKIINLYHIKEGVYPSPSDSFDITFSGSLAWKQGVFGESVRSEVGGISEVPVDPLTKNRYAYSTTNTKQEYELGAISESLLSQNIIHNQTYAGGSFYAYVKGNYNQKIITVTDPLKIYVLGVPTIITSEIESVTVQDIFQRQTFSIKRLQNLPGSYKDTLPVGETLTGSTFIPGGIIGNTIPILYEGTYSELANDNEKIKLGQNIRSYYQESNIDASHIPSAGDIFSLLSGDELGYINTIIRAGQGGLNQDVIVINDIPSILGVNIQSTYCKNVDYPSRIQYGSSFFGIKSNGEVIPWGGYQGGNFPSEAGFEKVYPNDSDYTFVKNDSTIYSTLSGFPGDTGYSKVFPSRHGFTAVKPDGEAYYWGTYCGGEQAILSSDRFTKIFPFECKVIGITTDGFLKEWGGGVTIAGLPIDSSYTNIAGNGDSFVGLKSDGSIKAWGGTYGGTGAPTSTNFVKVFSNQRALGALSNTGVIITWGQSAGGGTGEPTGGGFIEFRSTYNSFAALNSNGRVYAWGTDAGTGEPTGTGYIQLEGTTNAFAALNSNGTIISWGDAGRGGVGEPTGNGFVKIFSGGHAFAALKADGTIVSWGDANKGGVGFPTDSGYTQIHPIFNGFVAVKADGTFKSWGTYYLSGVYVSYDVSEPMSSDFVNINGTLLGTSIPQCDNSL